MFTNNYIAYRAMMFCHATYSSTNYPYRLSLYDTYGTERGHNSSYKIDLQYSVYGDIGYWLTRAKCTTFPEGEKSSNTGTGGVFFGSGSTPASKDDFRLESPITSGLSIVNQDDLTVTNIDGGKYEISAQYIVTNNTEAEINIYEIGVVSACGSETNKFYPFLMERTVLSVPIVIAPGEVKVVTYKITFNQTLNVE